MSIHRLPRLSCSVDSVKVELEYKAVRFYERFYDSRLAQPLHRLIDGSKSQHVGQLQCSSAHYDPFDFVQLSSEIMSPNIAV